MAPRPASPARDHPVVHVTFGDAEAFAAWEGNRSLPRPEWEFAARGGLDGADFACGRRSSFRAEVHWPTPGRASSPAATWRKTVTTGTRRSASFPPNGYGLHDMIGNVWEWTTDWYVPKSPGTTPGRPAALPRIRGATRGRELRFPPAQHPHPPQGAEGRIATSARPTTAVAIGRRRAIRNRSTPPPVTSASDALSGDRVNRSDLAAREMIGAGSSSR